MGGYRSSDTYHGIAGFDLSKLSNLPCALPGCPPGTISRLMNDGILRKAGRMRVGHSYRTKWDRGARFGLFWKWCQEMGKV